MDSGDRDRDMSSSGDGSQEREELEGGRDVESTPPPGKTDELESFLRRDLEPELEVVRRLGRGSVAAVYLARERALRRLVAVKVLWPRLARDERARMRFEREAQAAAGLSHPNIVPVHRVGRLSNGLPYIVMQYIKGTTMENRLQAHGPLAPQEARAVLAEVASAMVAAHKHGIVHRDIRLANVLYEEESGRALLGDFGIAAILTSGDTGQPARLTKTGELVGDPAHMSPEQLLEGEFSERSDVYALGLLGYELLTGGGPFGARTRRELATAHIEARPRKLSELRADVDPDLEDLLLRCLAKRPEHRPSSTAVARRLGALPADATPTPLGSVRPSPRGGILERITERRLPQVLVVYGAIGWGLLEVTAQLVERSILPEVAYQLILVAVVTGLPAVLIGAWFHGKRGRQRFTPLEYWLFGGLALIWLAISALILVRWHPF